MRAQKKKGKGKRKMRMKRKKWNRKGRVGGYMRRNRAQGKKRRGKR